MAAYAALCSLMHIIHQIQNHPRPPISLDKQQVQSLTENVTFLQEFLEGYSKAAGYSKEADPLESRIADAARAAEDVIESYIVEQIHDESTSHGVKISSVDFYQGLQKVLEDTDPIKKEAMETKDRAGVRDQQPRNSITPDDSSRPSSTGLYTMVGFNDALLEILDKLTGGQQDRQVIPIVGMGGMGKTTLARNVYVNPLIQQYFDICAWATISQEYDTRKILRDILCPGKKEELRDVEEIGEKLHKHFAGRRYLIILDDMWSIDAWDGVRGFFPDFNNGSRIVITTRLSSLTSQLTGSYNLKMKYLDNDKSWNLLCKTVFGEEGCPPELEEIGKKVAQNCRGLPLSIVVTGGLLAKSKHSRKHWECIAKNLNSLVNTEDDDSCLKILYMSYKQMPVYLKPCFLYMGIFPEDYLIRPSVLIRLWVAEGFLKPIRGKSLEEIAEECLEELIGRNLVRASRRLGKIKRCSIHDLLRDLCLREAQKERFFYVMKEHSFTDSKGIKTQPRIVISDSTFEKEADELQSMSLVRSLIREGGVHPLLLNFRLLRILYYKRDAYYSNHPRSLETMYQLVNLRYLAIRLITLSIFSSSFCLLWNLQTINVDCGWLIAAPGKIWNMPQLRHVRFVNGLYLPDPPKNDDDTIVLTNLQSLSKIEDCEWSEDVIKRIPNLKKLGIRYRRVIGSSHYFLNILDRLHKLESFKCTFHKLQKSKGPDFLHNLTFPLSLKKLTLKSSNVPWEDMMEKIGSLPLLEVLKLRGGSTGGGRWETTEDQFKSLKFLMIAMVHHLEYWNSEKTHFPRLEQLVLEYLFELKEIPSGIGEIATLESIELTHCSHSSAISARKILEEQEEFGDVTLQVRVSPSNDKESEALQSLASPNFQVR